MSGSSSTAEGALVESGLFAGFACSPPSDEPAEADALAESWDGASEPVSPLDSGVFDGQVEDVSKPTGSAEPEDTSGAAEPSEAVLSKLCKSARSAPSSHRHARSCLSCDVISALKQLKDSISPGKVSEKARKTPSRQVFTSHERPECAEKSKNVARTLRACSQN